MAISFDRRGEMLSCAAAASIAVDKYNTPLEYQNTVFYVF